MIGRREIPSLEDPLDLNETDPAVGLPRPMGASREIKRDDYEKVGRFSGERTLYTLSILLGPSARSQMPGKTHVSPCSRSLRNLDGCVVFYLLLNKSAS